MLKLTKRTDYGLIAMRHLATQPIGGACSASDMAEEYGIPPELLAKILQRLAKARLLKSQHGTRGGYTLAREARSISAFEVIQAIEGPLFMTSCHTHRGDCSQSPRCTVREPLRRLSEKLEQALMRMKISDMAADLDDETSAAPAPTNHELVTLGAQVAGGR